MRQTTRPILSLLDVVGDQSIFYPLTKTTLWAQGSSSYPGTATVRQCISIKVRLSDGSVCMPVLMKFTSLKFCVWSTCVFLLSWDISFSRSRKYLCNFTFTTYRSPAAGFFWAADATGSRIFSSLGCVIDFLSVTSAKKCSNEGFLTYSSSWECAQNNDSCFQVAVRVSKTSFFTSGSPSGVKKTRWPGSQRSAIL